MLAIWKREFQNYFLTPIGYVFMAVFLLAGGLFFLLYNVIAATNSLSTMFGNLSYLFMMIVPVLTMKLLAEEKRSKTDQLLLTSPLSLWSIVLGKMLAACAVFLLSLLITGSYVVIVDIFGAPAYSEVISGYLGFFLLGCGLIAVGTFISALTESQVTSAILSFGAMLFLSFAGSLSILVKVEAFPYFSNLVSMIDIFSRFNNFTYGIISLADVVYMLSFTGVFAFLTVRVIEKRRWSEG